VVAEVLLSLLSFPTIKLIEAHLVRRPGGTSLWRRSPKDPGHLTRSYTI